MKIKLFDSKGATIKDVDIKLEDYGEFSKDLITQYVRVYQLNQRQGTAKVKTKSEVRGGGRKPWRQKGLGRARAGSIRSPLWPGGGVIHGPSPRNWTKKFHKKMLKTVLKSAFILKTQDDKLLALDYSDKSKSYSTKEAVDTLSALKITDRVLVVHNGSDSIYRSFRNIRYVEVKHVDEFSPYDVLLAGVVVIEKDAISAVEERIEA